MRTWFFILREAGNSPEGHEPRTCVLEGRVTLAAVLRTTVVGQGQEAGP